MNIAIIGAGNVGSALATKWARKGHQVRLADHDDTKTAKVAAAIGATAAPTDQIALDADVVVFAVPFDGLLDAAEEAGDLSGKILVDATNVLGDDAHGGESAALALQEAEPDARVVKTLNTAFAEIHPETDGKSERPSQVLVGDDAAAKETVKTLIEDAGFEPFDAGGLDLAPDLEGFARVNISLAYGPGKRGPFFYYFRR